MVYLFGVVILNIIRDFSTMECCSYIDVNYNIELPI